MLTTEIVPSLVVAPASTYAEPSSTVAGLRPRIVMIGKIVSGGVEVLSVTSPATITPRAKSIVSTIDSSNNNLCLTSGLVSTSISSFRSSAASVSFSTPSSSEGSSTSSIARSTCLLSISSLVEYASTLSVISAISSSVIANP